MTTNIRTQDFTGEKTINGFTLDCHAEFFYITPDIKQALFNFQEKFQVLAHSLKTPSSMSQALADINALTKQVEAKKFLVAMNDKGQFEVSYPATMKEHYTKPVDKSVRVMRPSILVLYAIEWTEYERGYGQRPDGFSFHVSLEAANAFIHNQTKDRSGPVPDDYSNPGTPRLLEVSEGLHDFVNLHGDVWLWQKNAKDYLHYDASALFAKKAEQTTT